MAKSNAQRQAEYRARHLQAADGRGEQLSGVIDVGAKRALERVAACYGITQRKLIERLARASERYALEQVRSGGMAEGEYYDGKLRLEFPVT